LLKPTVFKSISFTIDVKWFYDHVTTVVTRSLFPFRSLMNRILARRLVTVRKPASAPQTKLYINGEFINSETTQFYELRNPATDEIVTYVPQATSRELAEASKVAQATFKQWKKTSILSRQRIMFELQALIRSNMVLQA
jgi:hypothetical protein